MHHNSFAGSDWLVPLFLYQPLFNETNECALLNAFISSRCEKVSERNDIEWSNIDGALPKPKRLHPEKKTLKFCISIVFSWDHCKSQEKLETILMQNLGGETKNIMVFSDSANSEFKAY